jgi:hypothetical protein
MTQVREGCTSRPPPTRGCHEPLCKQHCQPAVPVKWVEDERSHHQLHSDIFKEIMLPLNRVLPKTHNLGHASLVIHSLLLGEPCVPV